MKFILSMILCSQVAGTCLPPHSFPEIYVDSYDCMMAGYAKSVEKMKEIGREEVTKNGVFVKFMCVTVMPREEST